MSSTKSWVEALRLRTLPLAVAGNLIGVALAYEAGYANWLIAGLVFLTTILLQILSNLANDYGDASSGVDSDLREGPKRMVQSGQISSQAMRNAMILTGFLALATGITLIFISFDAKDFWKILSFLVLGILGIVAAIKYTVGKNPYGYAGFGDLFVFVFFGLVSVVGTYFLYTKTIDWRIFLPAISIGLFSVGVLNINNMRDIASDKVSGKNSIPVRLGLVKARKYHLALLGIGVLCSVIFLLVTSVSVWRLFVFLSFPLFIKNIAFINANSGKDLDPFLKQMALSSLLFAVLFALGCFIR